MRFSENLRNLRKSKDYSQEYLAEKLGVTRQTVSKWENATAMPDLKKLTEIADFFEISMDKLLGMEFENTDNSKNNSSAGDAKHNINENNNNEYNKQYAQQLFSMAYQTQYEQNLANHKMVKTITIIIAVFIACIIFCFILFFNEMTVRINNLQNQINQLNTLYTPQYYDEDENGDFEYRLLSADKEKPYMVNVEFKYSPNTYPKNASVYFTVPKADGTIQKIEAEEKDSQFIATASMDITAQGSTYIYIDDGENVTKENVFDGFGVYDFIWTDDGFAYNCTSTQSGIICKSENTLMFSYEIPANSLGKVKEVYLVAESGNKEVYSEKLKTIDESAYSDNETYSIHLPEFTLKSGEKIDSIYLKFINDSYNIVYKQYFPLNGDWECINYMEDQSNKKEIIFADDKILSDYDY